MAVSGVNFNAPIGTVPPAPPPANTAALQNAGGGNPLQVTDQYHGGRIDPGYGPTVSTYDLFNDINRPVNYATYKFSQRLSHFGIDNATEFLNKFNTPFQRKFMTFVGTMFMDRQSKQYIKQMVPQWIGQADLMRSGLDLYSARLVQASGVPDVPNLSRYWGVIDKAGLYSAVLANALAYGYRAPDWNQFSTSIDRARTLPPAIRW